MIWIHVRIFWLNSLFLNIIGLKCVTMKTTLINCFWKEWEAFKNKSGVFNKEHIWKLIEYSKYVAHLWYKEYMC